MIASCNINKRKCDIPKQTSSNQIGMIPFLMALLELDSKFKKSTYLNLVKFEALDQIDVAKYFGSLPYIDYKRIGIWGWSFGGHMATHCLLTANNTFSMAIAVAPVTNWRFYDTIYTERFLRTPQENREGYDLNSPLNYADQLEGKLLIIHGSGDDNVHVQNSMEMISALVAANKQFDLFILLLNFLRHLTYLLPYQ